MPISEKDIFASLMQDPNHAYQPLEKVWAEAVQRARQFRNNEKALALAFDTSPALEKLFDFVQKAAPLNQIETAIQNNLARLRNTINEMKPWAESFNQWGRQVPADVDDQQSTYGIGLGRGKGTTNIYRVGQDVKAAVPLLERVHTALSNDKSLQDEFGDDWDVIGTAVHSLFNVDGTLSNDLTFKFRELQNNEKAKELHQQALNLDVPPETPSEEAMSREEAFGAVGQDNPLTQAEPDIPELEQTTYDQYHPPEGETYLLDFIGPVPKDGQQQSIHNTMRKLLIENGHYEPVDIEGKEGQTLKRYYELVDTSHPDWKFHENADEHPDINGETFGKLRDAGLVTGSSARGKWKWAERTEALQALMKNMDRVRQVTETPVGDGVKYQSLKGQLHPALVDWIIDANAKGKLQPSYSVPEVAFHKSLGLGGGIQASPNEDLEAELAAEEAGEVESDDSEPEDGTFDNLGTPAVPPSTGLIATPAEESFLASSEVEPPTNEQVEETIENVQDSGNPEGRFFPRFEGQYLLPRLNGQDFNPLKVDGNPDGEDASMGAIQDNFKALLQNFHAMNYKHNPDSLPSIFGEYDQTLRDDGELLNPFIYALRPETWDDEKKSAYNEMRDNIGIHEGWLQGLIMAQLIPSREEGTEYGLASMSPSVIYEPPLTNETWDDKGSIKKGQWNWVEALRGLGFLDGETDDEGNPIDVDAKRYPDFSAIDHTKHGLDRGAGHGLAFVGTGTQGFHGILNQILKDKYDQEKDEGKPFWEEAEAQRKRDFMDKYAEFGATPGNAEMAWKLFSEEKGQDPARFGGPPESEFRPYPEEGTEVEAETFEEFIERVLREGLSEYGPDNQSLSPDDIQQMLFSNPDKAATEGATSEEGAAEGADAVEEGLDGDGEAPVGPVEGGLGLESPDWGQAPTPLGEPEPVLTPEQVEINRQAKLLKDQQDQAIREAQKLKEEKIRKIMDAYPHEDEVYQADHKRELETDDNFLASEWAKEIKRRVSVGVKAQAKAEKDEAQAAKEEEKEANKPAPLDKTERERLIQQIVDASKVLHPGLEMSAEKQQLLEYISENDEKGFRAEHAKIINALETKKQADAKLQRARDANNLDGFHGLKPLSSQQQPTEDDLIMQIRRIERWRKEHGADMSEASNQKLEEYWNEVNQFAANIGFDVDDQVNKDVEEAKQSGENYYGSSDWLDEVGKMHVDELGRKGNYDRQVAQGAELRGNRNYKPWLVIKYDRNGFGTFHDLRERDEEGDYGKQISPESLSFNEDEHYFDYKQDKEDLSQHPSAFNKFWNKIDRANFRPIDRQGFVERHGESGLTADTTHALLGERGTQTGWYHPESGSWVNPHRYREVRQSLEQAGTGAGMMILNGSQFTGNHKRAEDNVHPKYGFAHRGDKTLADAGDDTNDFSYYVDGEGNIAHSNANWDAVKQRDTNQIQDVNSVIHDWHSQNMNNMVRQDPNSWKSPDGQSVLPGKIIYPRQSGGEPIQNMSLLKDVQDFDALARRRKQTGYDPSQMKNVGRTGLAADELGGPGQWWGQGAEARQKYFGALDYIGSGVLGWWGELLVGGKSKSDRLIQRARKEYKLHGEVEKRTKNVMDNITWHGEKLKYLSPGEKTARHEDLGRLRSHLTQQRLKHSNLAKEAEARKDTAGKQHANEQSLKYSNDLNSLTGLNHEFDSHWKHINELYGQHMGGDAVHASMTPNIAEGSGAWADIFAQPSQQGGEVQQPVSSGLIGNASGASEAPPISGSAGLIGGSSQGEFLPREQTSPGVGLIG